MDEGVQAVFISTPQPLSGKGDTDSETGMEVYQTDNEKESPMSGDDSEGELGSQPDLMDQASSIINDWIDRIMHGREAALVLPRANPVISLMKEITVKAQFPLSERIPQNEDTVELVHTGEEGPWSDLSQTSSCEDLSNGSWSQPPDTDPEDVLVLDVRVVEDREGFQSSQQDTRPSLEELVPAQPRTEPSHPYQPPQITEARGEWYQGEDSFDPGQIAPSASPQLLPSPDGGLNWGSDEAMPPFRTDRPPFKRRSIQREVYYSRTAPGRGPSCHERLGEIDVAWPPRTSKEKCSGSRQCESISTFLLSMTPRSTCSLWKGTGRI